MGSLVSLAVKDITQLMRYELDLAKLELKADVRRLGLGGALLGVAAFVLCLVLTMLCFGLAYGLITVGVWTWAAFLLTALACVLLAAVAVVLGIFMMKRFGGLPKTRSTVQDDLAVLRRGDGSGSTPPARAR